MVGLQIDERPLLRAYSIASANHEEHLEFLSIKVPGRSANITPAAHPNRVMPLLDQPQAHGHADMHDLKPGKRLYLLSTGTGAAPFMSVIKEPGSLRSLRGRYFCTWCALGPGERGRQAP